VFDNELTASLHRYPRRIMIRYLAGARRKRHADFSCGSHSFLFFLKKKHDFEKPFEVFAIDCDPRDNGGTR